MFKMTAKVKLSDDLELIGDPVEHPSVDAAICALMDWNNQNFWPATQEPIGLEVTIERIT